MKEFDIVRLLEQNPLSRLENECYKAAPTFQTQVNLFRKLKPGTYTVF